MTTPALSLHPAVDRYDTPALTINQGRAAIRAMQRVLSGNTKLDDIVPMRNAPDCYRWKPTNEMRYQADCEIRCVFRYVASGVEVIAVGERHSIYRKVQSRL